MDFDPSAGSELDALGLYFPLPFRVASIIVLGVWAWGANLQYLQQVGIDVPALISYPGRTSSTHISHYRSCYRLASVITIPFAALLVLFWLITRGDPKPVQAWEILPNFYILVLVACFFIPFHLVSGSGRWRFLTTLKRIGLGGIAESQDGKFGDILLADALTSYAKVLGDFYISLCMFVSRRGSTGRPDRNCGGSLIVPLILAIPSLIRLRQCLIEYGRAQRASRKLDTFGKGAAGTHLANALKYSTAFPVIILSAIQRSHDPKTSSVSDVALFRIWMFFVVVNSAYSFYWDVAKDWDLTLFSKDRDDPEHPYGLRKHRYFQFKELYYFVIVLDLLLRFTWSMKLSPHLDHFNDMEGGIFLIEVLEVFRRWVWIFFRVETEWVRGNKGPATDDILLGDFSQSDRED